MECSAKKGPSDGLAQEDGASQTEQSKTTIEKDDNSQQLSNISTPKDP